MSHQKRKHVLFLITKSNWGGAQRYVYDLATHLDSEQFTVTVALGGEGDLSALLTHAGVKVIKIKSLDRDISVKMELNFARELWSILRSEKPDVLHVNSSKAGGVGTLLGRLAFVPRVIFTSHGWAFNEDRPWWQRIIIKFLHWLTVLFSHQTIAVSRAIIRQMNWWGVQHKMKIIHPGRTIGVMYGKQEARGKIAEICPALQAHLSHTWIITIAELHPIKRIPVLLSAMKQIRTAHKKVISVIIGDGSEREHLEQLIEKDSLADTVFLTGNITEAARFLKAGDLFVLPSRSESYGYVLHEAGLASVPVVATNVGGIPDVVIDNQTGRLIPPDDPAALATELKDFLTNRARFEEFSQTHHQAMINRSVESMAEDTAALYNSLR